VRRLTAWIGGVAGGIAAYRLLRRRSQAAPPEPVPSEADERAEELRAKLAESKRTESPAAQPVVDDTVRESPAEPVAEEHEPAPEPESPEDRRRQVHEEGRAALDEMKPDGSNS
jgi:hypothetical protein